MARGQAWSLDDKINAAFAYIVTGYAEQASQICAVPKRTINDWLKQEWFQGLIKEAQAEKRALLRGQVTSRVERISSKDRLDEIQKALEKPVIMNDSAEES